MNGILVRPMRVVLAIIIAPAVTPADDRGASSDAGTRASVAAVNADSELNGCPLVAFGFDFGTRRPRTTDV